MPAEMMMELAVALETGVACELTKLNELDHHEFELAIGMISDWRLDRHYMSKLHLLDLAQSNELEYGSKFMLPPGRPAPLDVGRSAMIVNSGSGW